MYALSWVRNQLLLGDEKWANSNSTQKDMRNLSLCINPRKSMKNLNMNAVNMNIAKAYESLFFSC